MNTKLITVAIAMSAWAGTAGAVYVNEDGPNPLSDRLDSGFDITINANLDQLPDGNDSYWQVLGDDATSTILLELAGKSGVNTFGIYDPVDKDNYFQLFDGAASVNDAVALEVAADGAVTIGGNPMGSLSSTTFGFYLARPGERWFYSDSSLNLEGRDQMAAYQGDGSTVSNIPGDTVWDPSDYVLAWEDLLYNASKYDNSDLNDFVVYIQGITPVPEPGTLALLGIGLAGLGIARRRKA